MWCSVAFAAEGYVGAQVCGGCHRGQYTRQSRSHHANALRRGAAVDSFPFLPQVITTPDVEYAFIKSSSEFRVVISGAATKLNLPIDWIVGANDQGLTFFSRSADNNYVEHRLSYYRRKGGFDITAGQSQIPARALDVIGAPVSAHEASRCLGCHSTYLRSTPTGPDYESMIAGVTCERCHGPGAAHVAAMKSGSRDFKIKNPGKLSGDDLLAMCGECHRTEPPVGVAHDEPIVTRFQPVGLQMSNCFQVSNGKLTCTTCHDPHEDARRNDNTYYEAKCNDCHAKPSVKRCSTNSRTGCIGCHMPKVQPLAWVSFTDHWIRPSASGARR